MLELGIVARYPRLLQNKDHKAGGSAVTFTFHGGSIFSEPHVLERPKTPTAPLPGNGSQPPAAIPLLLAQDFMNDSFLLLRRENPR